MPRAALASCPGCGASLRVPENARAVLCGRCRTRFNPNGEAAPAPADIEQPDDEASVDLPPPPLPDLPATAQQRAERSPSTQKRIESQLRKVLRPEQHEDSASHLRQRLDEPTQDSVYEQQSDGDGRSAGMVHALEQVEEEFRERFDDLEPLSKGGMGALYKATQKRPVRTVVLKVMLAGRFASPRYRLRFEREMMAIARLTHPHIVSIYECGQVEGQPYFTMEYVDGLHIRSYADSQRLKKREVCELMCHVCDAVAYAHQRGVIHRDLKPSNVLVDREGRPRVLDFGLAQLDDGDSDLQRMTESGEIMGTPAYMSPEQTLGRPHEIDVRTDVYSIGVMLYELLTGRLPYTVDRSRPLESMRTVREVNPKKPSTVNRVVDRDLEAIVMKCLAKRKEARYSSAADLAADMRRYLQGNPVDARPATTFYQVRKLVWRNRAVFLPIVAATLMAVALTAVLIWHLVRSSDLAKRDADIAREAGKALVRRQKGVVELLREFEGLQEKVDDLLAQGKPGKAFRLAKLAQAYLPMDEGVDELVEMTTERVLSYTDERIDETRRLVRGLHYTRARGELKALMALSGELTVPSARGRIKALADSFDDACWQSCQAQVQNGKGGIKVLSDFATECPRSVHRAEACKRIRQLTESIRYAGWPFDVAEAARRQKATAELLGVPPVSALRLGKDVVMSLALVPAGEFRMGDSHKGAAASPQRVVRITRPFYMGATEVTVAQYSLVTGQKYDPSRAQFPMGGISWEQAVDFCRRLADMTGLSVRLPTEAEWEYACRAGTPTRFSFGEGDNADGPGRYAWYRDNSEDAPGPAGKKLPNAWALHDMHGNVLEWCADRHGVRRPGSEPYDDPTGPATGDLRVLRGGCWRDAEDKLGAPWRTSGAPGDATAVNGMRVCVDVLPRDKDEPSLKSVSVLILD